PSHPIAGDERTGAMHASAQLYRNRKTYITPTDFSLPEATTILRLWEAMGARVEVMDAALHDRIFAQSSHVLHLLSFAYGALLVDLQEAIQPRPLDASYRHFIRIGGAGIATWCDVFHFNHDAIGQALVRLRQ